MQELERARTGDDEFVVTLYDWERKRLVVRVEYGCRSDYPVLYRDGKVGWDFPELIADRTRAMAGELLREIRNNAHER